MSVGSRRFRGSPAVLARRVGPELLLAIPDAEEIFSLGASAPTMWRMMDTPVTVPELVDGVADIYGRATADVHDHVKSLIQDLVGKGLAQEVSDEP